MNKYFMSVLALLVVGLLSFTCISCGGDDDSPGGGNGNNQGGGNGDNPTEKNISKANVTDAMILFVAPSDYLTTGNSGNEASRRANNDNYTLFKVKLDGSSEKVNFYNTDGSQVTCNVSKIIKAEGSPYIVLFATIHVPYTTPDGHTLTGTRDVTLLANKSTGAIYNVPNRQGLSTIEYGSKVLKTDKIGNLYYSDNYVNIYKIDVSDPNNITGEIINPESDRVSNNFNNFALSSNGEMCYRLQDNYNFVRLRNTQGRLFNLTFQEGNEYGAGLFYRGLNGNLRVCHTYNYGNGMRYGIFEIEFLSNGNYQLKEIQTMLEREISFYWIVTLPNIILGIDRFGWTYILDSTNPADYTANTGDYPINVVGNEWADMSTGTPFGINDLHYNNSYIYCSGKRNNSSYSLLRIDVNTYQCETVIQDNNYEIYSFTVNSDDSVTFTGLRMSDGKNVLVTIDKNGTVINEKVTSTNEKIMLERIN